MKRLLLFGNPALPEDNLAVRVGAELAREGWETLHVENPLELLTMNFSENLILDVAINTEEPVLVKSLDSLLHQRSCTLHDFDAAFILKLRDALGEDLEPLILALPAGMELEAAVAATREHLHNL